MNKSDKIPLDLLPYLQEIVQKLKTDHATVMIGAGFSKNAQNNGFTKKGFPDWNELGDLFYEKIHGTKPKLEDKAYLNVLKLADEVQAAFKRTELDNILINEIPDKEYQPSVLHAELLKLPWTDVFTTNYDTLLERCSEQIIQRRYETVVNKEDLIRSTKPRILKLHGSFPSVRPFIITEEDYRTYPKKNAPFVNTVQQSLLENTLCLIGFSGDDPNFLNWIGWIRDNLGNESPPNIYMIGILNLTIGQKKLLENRNIVPIDLSNIKGVEGDHYKSLEFFIEYLRENIKNTNNLFWPEKNKRYIYSKIAEMKPKISHVIKNWREKRLQYPNWLILPEDQRDILLDYTAESYTLFSLLKDLVTPLDIEFLYEYNWRIEKCLDPIDNRFISNYENIIKRYNPFPDLIQIQDTVIPDSQNKNTLDWKKTTLWWLEIQFSILRYYREEGLHDKWIDLSNLIIKLKGKLTPELKARFSYESCLYYLFCLNITKVRETMATWPTDKTLPYWEAKKACLLAELGNLSEAQKILNTSLNTIRSRSYLTPVSDDFSGVSKEAFIMQLKRYVDDSISFMSGQYLKSSNENKELSERWNTLKQYKCDPWAELKSFQVYLEKEPAYLKKSELKYGFDLFSLSKTYQLGGTDKYAQKAYSYLRFIEETGIPYQLPIQTTLNKKTTMGAITHIANLSSFWGLAAYVRFGEIKNNDSIFGRKSLSELNQKEVDTYASNYLYIIKNSKNEIQNSNKKHRSGIGKSIATVIPDILSKLCVKCSYTIKLELLEFLKFVFESEDKDLYKGIKNLTNRLINSLTESEIFENIPLLLQFPLVAEPENSIAFEYSDPFEYINASHNNSHVELKKEQINQLINFAQETDKRKPALTRLIRLWQLKLLTEQETVQLSEILWCKTEKRTGFPTSTNYYYYSFINLPHPSSINPEELLRTYISTISFPIHAYKKENKIPMTNGDDQLFGEINGTASSEVNFKWSKNDIKSLSRELIKWWDADKKYLKTNDAKQFGSRHDEFQNRFRNLNSILSDLIPAYFHYLSDRESIEIKRILEEAREYNLFNVEVIASYVHIFPEIKENIHSYIYNSLFSKSRNEVVDALSACVKLIKVSPEDANDLIPLIGENIRSLNKNDLKGSMKVMTFIVSNYSELINTKTLKDLRIGLTNLISDTIISKEDSDKNVHNKLNYRQAAAHLTVALSKYYILKEITVPQYVLDWKGNCLNLNEFSEIRNIWRNYENLIR